ncbi:MAG: bifunctional folylpolyglutamate synthase/dihydrofolate synthase [Eubacterium sp.]|nr:bifunctional folylpolyglutamate synthase/dihydrofolate synthase [Eubacterium sp.]
MNYNEVLSYIYDIPRFTTKHGLEYSKRLLGWLGHPEESFRVIHVAGSNGKGSVCAYLNSILRECKIRTGLFTSPHLNDIRERFLVDGEMITKEEFLEDFDDVMKAVKENGEEHPTFFELLFLMAALRFKKAGTEVVVFETGLGGRLDATNSVAKPEVCVITSLSLEHTEYLGNTIEEIAREKGGIIKENVPVVFDASNQEAAKVLSEISKEKHAAFYEVKPENIKILETNIKGIDFSFTSKYYNLVTYVNTPAVYQTMNASLAAVCARLVLGEGADKAINDGIKKTRWQGRMEEALPKVFIDGAHNPAGIDAFVKSVKNIPMETKPMLLFSVVNDKDYNKMADILTEDKIWESVCICGIDDKRALDKDIIKEMFSKRGYEPYCFETSREAFLFALDKKEDNQYLFVAGSLYFAGEIKEIINDRF